MIRRYLVDMPWVGLSSTDIRQRVSRGQSIRFRTPAEVAEYIHVHDLFGDEPGASAHEPGHR